MTDLLLRWGADETVVDRDGKTPVEVVGQRRADEDGDRAQDEIDEVRKLLANAPADRAWRRRGCLVLCREFLQQDCCWLQRQREQQLLSIDGTVDLKEGSFFATLSARRPSKTSDPENKMWSELASAEAAPQTPLPPVPSAAAALGCIGSTRASQQEPGEIGARAAVGKAGGVFDEDDLRTLLVRLFDFPEEGVFRNMVMFL